MKLNAEQLVLCALMRADVWIIADGSEWDPNTGERDFPHLVYATTGRLGWHIHIGRADFAHPIETEACLTILKQLLPGE